VEQKQATDNGLAGGLRGATGAGSVRRKMKTEQRPGGKCRQLKGRLEKRSNRGVSKSVQADQDGDNENADWA